MTHQPFRQSRNDVRGLTMVELMVALAISLTLVVAASMLYLNTRFSQRSTDERGQLQETGQMALELIGSQIGNAAFYPLVSTAPNTPYTLSSYRASLRLITGTPPVAIASGLFGCAEGVVKTDLSGCNANVARTNAPGSDSLAVAYFTNDAMSLDIGSRADCTRADIANDAAHNDASRVGTITKETTLPNGSRSSTTVSRGTSLGVPTAQPMMGINLFQLEAFDYVDDTGKSFTTYALSCRGNGRGLNSPQVLVPGVVQMTFRYGVASDDTWSPVKYLSADEVNADPDVVMDGADALSTWDLVVSVRACVMVRSLNPGAAKVTSGAVKDCNGDDYTPVAGAAYQTFTQVFGVKNRLKRSVSL